MIKDLSTVGWGTLTCMAGWRGRGLQRVYQDIEMAFMTFWKNTILKEVMNKVLSKITVTFRRNRH